jgi:hypothetical protein
MSSGRRTAVGALASVLAAPVRCTPRGGPAIRRIPPPRRSRAPFERPTGCWISGTSCMPTRPRFPMFFGGLPLSPFRKKAAGERDRGEVKPFTVRPVQALSATSPGLSVHRAGAASKRMELLRERSVIAEGATRGCSYLLVQQAARSTNAPMTQARTQEDRRWRTAPVMVQENDPSSRQRRCGRGEEVPRQCVLLNKNHPAQKQQGCR